MKFPTWIRFYLPEYSYIKLPTRAQSWTRTRAQNLISRAANQGAGSLKVWQCFGVVQISSLPSNQAYRVGMPDGLFSNQKSQFW
jgi:hypothetical protein